MLDRPPGGSGPLACLRWILAAAALSAPHPVAAQEALTVHRLMERVERNGAVVRQAREALRSAEGHRLASEGALDLRFGSSVSWGRDHSALSSLEQIQYPGLAGIVSQVEVYRVGLARRFSSGLSVSPGVELVRSSLDLRGDVAPSSLPPDDRGRASVLLTQPLLRGRGSAAVLGPIRAAESLVASSRAAYGHTRSSAFRTALSAYWAHVAAVALSERAVASEARAQRLLEESEVLVAADQQPAADLDQLRADLAERTGVRIRANRNVVASRLTLGVLMGLDASEAASLPPPADDFPPVALPTEPLPAEALVALALRNREDVAAARAQVAAAAHGMRAAERDRLPALDVELDFGYSGLGGDRAQERFLSPLFRDVTGLNLRAGVRYELPVRNRTAEGVHARSRAAHAAADIAAEDAARRAEMEVRVAIESLAAAENVVRLAQEALVYHGRALGNERVRFSQGLSTLFAVVFHQDRLAAAEIAVIGALVDHAEAVASLRHATGTLLDDPPGGWGIPLPPLVPGAGPNPLEPS